MQASVEKNWIDETIDFNLLLAIIAHNWLASNWLIHNPISIKLIGTYTVNIHKKNIRGKRSIQILFCFFENKQNDISHLLKAEE